MQRIEYTQKPMRVPDRGCAVRKKMELQRMLTAAVIATAIALVFVSAVVTGIRQANMASTMQSLPSNVMMIEMD